MGLCIMYALHIYMCIYRQIYGGSLHVCLRVYVYVNVYVYVHICICICILHIHIVIYTFLYSSGVRGHVSSRIPCDGKKSHRSPASLMPSPTPSLRLPLPAPTKGTVDDTGST